MCQQGASLHGLRREAVRPSLIGYQLTDAEIAAYPPLTLLKGVTLTMHRGLPCAATSSVKQGDAGVPIRNDPATF